jgi:hypothetical protein
LVCPLVQGGETSGDESSEGSAGICARH